MPSVELDDDVARVLLAAEPPEREHRSGARSVAGLAAAGALAAVAATGLQLGWRYVPDRDDAYPTLDSGDWSRRLVEAHELAMVIAVAAVCVWALLVLGDSHGRGQRARGVVETGAAAAAVGLAVVTWFSWSRVSFEHVASWNATVGGDVEGPVWAAFSDQVRFVIVNGAEITQDAYARWVIVHLASPLLALTSMAVAWATASDPADL